LKYSSPKMEANTVSYKVSLASDNTDTEVRRFVVDRDVSTSLTYFREKLASVFPYLRRVDFDVAWTDDDGDKVTVKSDDELVIALTEQRGPIYKFSVQLLLEKLRHTEPDDSSSGNSDGEEHVGVVCDGCDRPVVGFRYKCVTCADYDLCGRCETKGIHRGHNMIRISTPQSVWPQHFYRRLHRMHDKAQKKRCGGPCNPQAEEHPSGCQTGPAGPSPRCRGPSFRHHGHQWFEAMTKGWTGLGEAQAAAQQAAKEAFEAHRQAAASGNPGGASQGGLPTFESMMHPSNSAEFLRNLGQLVAGALDPFGVDVKIEVESPEPKTAESSSPSSDATKTAEQSSDSAETKKDESAESSSETADASAGKKDDENDWTLVNQASEVREVPVTVVDASLYPQLPSKEASSAQPSAPKSDDQVSKQSYKTFFFVTY